jgi:uncharacterized membrane protein
MNSYKKILIACFISLFTLFNLIEIFALPPSKSYSVNQIKIAAEILPDGSLSIEENRSYTFRGNFRWADYSLPLKNLGRVTDFKLSENEIIYHQGSDEEPGTYQYSQNEEKMYIKWFYRARNERRTFTLNYRIEDAVTVYNDIAELYYKFVSEKSEKSIHDVDVLLKFPQYADTSQVRAWAHGPLHGQLVFESGVIHLWVSPLTGRNWWEVRAIFPPEWVSSAQKRRDEFKREQIMHEEQLLVAQSNAKRLQLIKKQEFKQSHRQTASEVSLILAVIGLAALVFLYNRYGKAYQVPFYNKISSDISRDVTPAIANYLYYSGQIGPGALVATLLDLASRGFLKIEEIQKVKKSIFGTFRKTEYNLKFIPEAYEKNKNELAAYERDMIQFIFQTLAAGNNEIQLDEIKDSRRQVMKWFSKWKKMIESEWGNKPFYDKSSLKGTVISAIISVLIIVCGTLIIIYLSTPGAIAVVAGVVLFGLSFIILRYTKDVKLLRAKLNAFKQYLLKYHFKKDVGNLQSSIERFLIYGVALGIRSKVMKEILTNVPEWQSSAYFAWYAGAMSHGSPAGFADAVTSMVSAASATMGSAAGVGGGASVGGGAGAGGASGGAG